jgi:hypothetical protein
MGTGDLFLSRLMKSVDEPNKALQRTAAVRHRCIPGFSAPLSLSFRR